MQGVFVGFAAGGPVFAVVDFAVPGGSVAVREDAGAVAGDDVVGEVSRWAVGAAAVVEDVSGGGVGEDASPGAGLVGGDTPGGVGGDRAVTLELGRLIIAPQQRRCGHGDVD